MSVQEAKQLVIIDDDHTIAQPLKEVLENNGYHVNVFFDAPQFFRHVQDYGLPHLALVDLNLPSTHGFQLSEQLKAMGDVPIIFISADSESKTIVDAITDYADDYIVKPMNEDEVAARVRRVLSRISDTNYLQARVTNVDDDLAVDFTNGNLKLNGRTITLTPTEARLLHILIRNAGAVVSSETLLARVWPREQVYEETLRVHMHRLRRKIEPQPDQPHYIQTVRGIGYCFVSERN